MLAVSLWLNIVVLVPVLLVLARNRAAAANAWGQDTPARRILASIYAAILVASIVLVLLSSATTTDIIPWTQTLLAVQVIYKALSAFAVGLRNPVVLSNIGIALIHSATLATLWNWPAA
jgi:hypothetical protein